MSRKKLGKMKGPSHQKGGIPIEVEGGEYVIKKSSVIGNEAALDYINEYGKLPTNEKEKIMPKGKGTYGSQVGRPPEDARGRSVKTYAGGGEVGYDSIGNPMYEKGGKVMDIPGEQVKWASKKEKKKGFKPSKKGKFFSKERRDKRKAKRQERRDKRQGVVKKVETKAGDYKVYKKDSKKAKSFREAFKAAKGKDFTWDGRKYSGKTKEQAAKSKAKSKEKPQPKPKPKPDKSLGMNPKKPASKTPKPKDFKKTKKVSPALGPVNKPKKAEPKKAEPKKETKKEVYAFRDDATKAKSRDKK